MRLIKMFKSLKESGIASDEVVLSKLPANLRRGSKGYAVIECFQEIPCNPCSVACPKDAIKPFDNINDIPQIDYDICDGCGICIALCPGLAIFAVDESYSSKNKGKAIVKIPHEFYGVQKGDRMTGLDRAGKEIEEVTVIKCIKNISKTTVLHIEVSLENANIIRAVKVI